MKPPKRPRKRLTDDDIKDIRERAARGEKLVAIAKRYEVANSWVSILIHGGKRRAAGGPILPRTERHRTLKRPVLTDHQIVTIRLKAHAGHKRADLASEYGVYPEYITAVTRGLIGADLPGPRSSPAKVLTMDDVVDIRKRYAEGNVSMVYLAEEYSVHRDTVRYAILGRTWKYAPGPITNTR